MLAPVSVTLGILIISSIPFCTFYIFPSPGLCYPKYVWTFPNPIPKAHFSDSSSRKHHWHSWIEVISPFSKPVYAVHMGYFTFTISDTHSFVTYLPSLSLSFFIKMVDNKKISVSQGSSKDQVVNACTATDTQAWQMRVMLIYSSP